MAEGSHEKKLTLSLEKSLIERAKRYAEASGKSVSQLVSTYFKALTKEEFLTGRPGRDRPLPTAVEDLAGIAEDEEEDYYRYLEEKHR